MTSTDTGFTDNELEASQDEPINQIENHLFLGSVESRTPEILRAHNIGCIVRITTEVEEQQTHYLLPSDIKETVYYISDDPSRLIVAIIKKAHYIIKRRIEDGYNVLVHCEAGISRSASVVIGHLMIEKRMSADNALKYVESKRKCVWPNAGFWKQLVELEEELEELRKLEG